MADNTVTHPQYAKHLKIWQTVRDAASPDGVKEAGVKYLPKSKNQTEESSNGNDERYTAYLNRAVYYGFTQETLSGLLGLSFRQGVTIETEGKDYIEQDVDGDGVGLEQQAKSSTKDVLKYGRCGLLVDFPTTEGAATIEQQARLGLIATINRYDTFAIRDWATKRIGARTVLSYVSLDEVEYRLSENGEGTEEVKIQRKLRLDDDNQYYVEILEDTVVIDSFHPTDANGASLDYIPFYFIGAVNNDSNVDDSPAYPIADLNIAHYRNSADYENSAWLCGQPQPWASGLTQSWVDANMKTFSFGSGVMLALPDGASFGIEQVQPNTIAFEAMNYKQEAMVAMGAKLINAGISFGSASEAIIASASENSRLQTVIDNVEQAYQAALESVAVFMGGDVPMFTIDTDLSAIMSDPQLIVAMVSAWQAGLIGKSDARDYMRKAGAIDRTDEDIDDEIENEPTLNLDDGDMPSA